MGEEVGACLCRVCLSLVSLSLQPREHRHLSPQHTYAVPTACWFCWNHFLQHRILSQACFKSTPDCPRVSFQFISLGRRDVGCKSQHSHCQQNKRGKELPFMIKSSMSPQSTRFLDEKENQVNCFTALVSPSCPSKSSI